MLSKNIKKRQVAICTEVGDRDNSTYEIVIDAKSEGVLNIDNYLLEITDQRMASLYRIIELIDADKDKIEKLEEKNLTKQYFSVDKQYLYVTDLSAFFFDKRADFESVISFALFDIKCRFEELKKKDIDERRKGYLKTRYYAEIERIQNCSSYIKDNCYSELNLFDYDLNQIISIDKLCQTLLFKLESSDNISNIDKIALRGIIADRCKKKTDKVIPKGIIDSILDSPPAIYSDDGTKDLVWNYRTKAEYRVNFHFLWGLIKTLMASICVPLILLLLKEGVDKRIYLYSVLAFVYLISHFFSDEKQTERLIELFKRWDIQISYATLFIYGIRVSIFFLVFSMEMIGGLIDSVTDLFIYLIADVAITSAIAYVGLLISTLVTCILIRAEYSRILKIILNLNNRTVKKLLFILFFLISGGATFWAFGGKEYLENRTQISDGNLFIIFCVSFFVILVICSVLRKPNNNRNLN